MHGCFAADARRAFVSSRMALAILMCAALYLLGTVSEIGSTDPLYLLDSAMNVGTFSYLMPLVAALPFSGSFLEDRNTGYIRLQLQRVTPKRYLTVRFFTVTLSGAVATAMGMLVFLAVLPLLHPLATLPTNAEGIAAYPYMQDAVIAENWLGYYAFYACLQALSGMFWAGVALTLSALVSQAQILYLSVVLLMEILNRILFALHCDSFTSLSTGAVQATQKSQVLRQSSLVFVGLTVVCYVLFRVFGERRLSHA